MFLQRNYRETYADLRPLASMLRAFRAGRNLTDSRTFSDPRLKLEQLRRLADRDPGLRLARLRERHPDLAREADLRAAERRGNPNDPLLRLAQLRRRHPDLAAVERRGDVVPFRPRSTGPNLCAACGWDLSGSFDPSRCDICGAYRPAANGAARSLTSRQLEYK